MVLFLLACCFPAFAQSCADQGGSTIAWWPFDDSPCEIAAGRHAVVTSPTEYIAGVVGKAFRFDGSVSDYLHVPDSSAWDFGADDFTIEFWVVWFVVRDSVISLPDTVFVGHDETSGNFRKWFFARGGGMLNFHVNSPDLGPIFFCLASFTPTPNEWYHLAVTRQSSEYRIYIDGQLAAVDSFGLPIPDANVPLTIGSAEGLGFFDGAIDELTLHGRTLSPENIAEIVAAGSLGKCRGAFPYLGDTNGDCCVDDQDLTAMILDYGTSGGLNGQTDADRSGTVDDADLTIAILNFGAGCE